MANPVRSRRAFTLIELLVVIAIIAVLIGLLLPAVQRVREAAMATRCRNNLKQIALATVHFHDAVGAFPPARIIERPDPNLPPPLPASLSWLVRILPYIEQQSVYDGFDLSLEFQYQLEEAREPVVATYLCPTRRGPDEARTPKLSEAPPITLPCGCSFPGGFVKGGACSDYAGNLGDLSPGSTGLTTDFYWGGNSTGIINSCRPSIPDSLLEWRDRIRVGDVTDGLSSTFLVGEMHVPIGKLATVPENGAAFDGTHFYNMSRVGGPGVPIANGPFDDVSGMGLYAFGSWHRNQCHFAFADGHVRSISPDVSTEVLERLCHRADGNVIPD
jgi:prepilin-type N-terminal cleavage/methylation domain-containing protein/prepilin-type processing-associated H-X9-DG protein